MKSPISKRKVLNIGDDNKGGDFGYIKYHPIWNACIGSELRMMLENSSDKLIRGMTVKVYTMSPRIYLLQFNVYENDEPFYSGREEAITILKNEWLMYYANQTTFEYIEHNLVDMSKFLKTKPSSPTKRLSLSLQRLSLSDSGDSSKNSYSTSLDESSNSSISSPVSSGERSDSARDRLISLGLSWKSRSTNTSPR
jgi:hypothetical protein